MFVTQVPKDVENYKIADIKKFRWGHKWVCCPYCGTKIVRVVPETKIDMLFYRCKWYSCRKLFFINVKQGEQPNE